MSQVSSTRKLLSASAVMASGTMISRILGMLRVVLIAFILGNGTRQADILSIATMVPNALYVLFAGGALNTVLVPQIVRAIKHDEDGGEAFTNRIMTAFMLIVGAVAAVAVLCAPLVTMLYSDSAWRQPALAEQYASMVALTYLTLPQIFFYGAFFLLSQILNAHDRFGPMMWAPIANNVISILVLGTYLVVWGNDGDKSAAFTTSQILVLGVGSTLGIAAQSLVLLPLLKRIGFKLRPRFDLKGTGLRHTFSLTKWTLGFVAVNQLALVVVNRLATTATAGGAGAGVNVYSNAHLLWILPHSLVTTSLATAMLSNASRLAADDDRTGVAQEMTKTARLALIFLVPATAVFLALSGPISSLLFGHGQGTTDAQWVGSTLVMFALGLIPFTVQFLCLRTYYALEDTRTPFRLQIGIASLNALGAVILVWIVSDPTRVAPMLALSYSVAYVVGVFVSWRLLTRRLPALDGGLVAMHIVRLALGAAPGALLAWLAPRWMRVAWSQPAASGLDALTPSSLVLGGPAATVQHFLLHARIPLWVDVVAICVGGLLVLASTVLVGKALHIRELRRLTELLRRGRGSRGAAPAPEPAPTLVEPDGPPTEIRLRPLIPGTFEEDLDPLPATPVVAPDPSAPARAAVVPPPVDEPEHVEPQRAEDAETVAVPTVAPIGEPGLVLGVRYLLSRRLQLRPHSESWLAHDQVLDRDVVAHLMVADDPHAETLLNAARRGAAATDSRFLRVLDVDRCDDDSRVGVYAICEHVDGRTLRELAEFEPMSARDAAYVVREVADALSPMHAQGLFHEHIDPDHVVITRGGAVRIVGFGTAAALEAEGEPLPWSQREAQDVTALAAVLRAARTGQWSTGPEPHGDGYALAEIWQGAFEGRVVTMDTLRDLLPPDDASAQLEARMGLADRARVTPRPMRTAAEPSVAAPGPPSGDEEDADRDEDRDGPDTVVAGAVAAPTPSRPRLVFWGLVALALVTLVVGLVAVATRGGSEGPSATTSASPRGSASGGGAAEPATVEIASVKDFDPEADGGNGEENPGEVQRAVDGDTDTAWTTVRYLRRPTMGGLKPGVGLVLDLGREVRVEDVDVTFAGSGPTAAQLRAPKGDEASTRSEADWRVVATANAKPGAHTFTPEGELTTRYLLVYLTELPPVDGGFRGAVAEIAVRGQ